MTEAVLRIKVDSTEVEKGSRSLDSLAKSSGTAEASTSKLTDSSKRLAAAAVAVASSLAVRELVSYTNRWTDLNSKLVNATGSQEAADKAMQGISQTARTTYSSLEATANTFLRNSMTLKELGYSMERQINLSDALNNSLVISGTKGAQAESVMNALSKAFAEGQLRGENFNSVIANGGRTVQALADGLGVSTLKLRSMAEAGELTTGKVVDALTSQMEKLREEAEAMPATIGDAFGQIGNATFELVGRFDTLTGTSTSLADVIVGVADNMRAFNEVLASMDAEVAELTSSNDIQEWGGNVADTFAFLADSGSSVSSVFSIIGKSIAANYAMSKALLFGTMDEFDAIALAHEAELVALVASTTRYRDALAAMRLEQENAIDTTQEFNDETYEAWVAAQDAADAADNAAGSVRTYGKEVKITADAHDYHIKLMEDFRREQERNRDSIEGTISALEYEAIALGLTSRAQAIFQAVTEATARGALPEQIARIAELTAKNYDLAASQNAATKAASDLEKTNEQAAKITLENWQRTHEYMTDAFVDLMDNGENAFDNIAKSFETMVKRMVAEWAASKLMDVFNIAGGGGSGGGFSFGGSSRGAGGSVVSSAASSAVGALLKGVPGSASFVGPVAAGGGAGIGGSIMGAIGAIPGWGWAAMGAAALGAMLNNDDGKVRSNAGMLVAPTPGAKPEYTFATDQFASGLNVTGFARREDQSAAEEIIQQFRDVDALIAGAVRTLGGTIDLSKASLAGLNEDGRAGSSGTFLGRGLEGGDIGAQINSFVDQLADHIWGLDDSLLNAVRSAGSAEEALKLLGDAADKITENNSWLNAKTALLSKYASEEQKVAAARDEINKTFGSFNREVPQSIEELYKMIETLDPLTESGRDAIEALGSLGGAIEMVARAASGGASATAAKFTGSGIPITSPFHQSIRDALVAGYSNIPAFASGGYHSGGLAIVGERGPELVDMSPARVYNNQDTTRMMRGDNSTAVEVRNLRQDMQNMLIAMNSIVVSSNQTARALDQATKQGEGALAVVSI